MSNYAGVFIPEAANNPWNKAFNLITPHSTVLDVGCSLGNFGEALAKYKDCIVDGVEPDASDAEVASKKLRKVANSFIEDALKTTFKDRKYNHVVFLDVIEHLYDPAETLKTLRQHLKPNGSIIFSIPNMAHISVRLMLLKGDFEYGDTGLLDNTHLHFYTKREIERVFTAAGYTIDTFDNTDATYSNEILDDELKKLGIKTSPKLRSILQEESARIFQYVGEAKVGIGKQHKRAHYSPDPQGVLATWYEPRIKYLEEKLMNMEKLNQEQAAILANEKELASRIRFSSYMKNYGRRVARKSKNGLCRYKK